jgi:iron complex outermembrane receptor protein
MRAKLAQLLFLGAATILYAQKDTIYHPIERVIINTTFSAKKTQIHTKSTDWLNHDAGKFLTETTEFSGIRKSGNYASDPVFRGFKYEQLNIIADGAQNAIQACPSRMDAPVSQINMNQIEKVEIYKGPYFFRFGSSIGATANFVSFKPEFSDGFKASGRLKVMAVFPVTKRRLT